MILLPEIGSSCMEEPPIRVSGATALEDEEAGLVLGAILTVKSLLKVMKMEESFEIFS